MEKRDLKFRNDSKLEDLSKGIDLFNNEFFFEAHDFFEKKWIDARGEEKLFFQGLVQISVGSYHLTHGKLTAALSQFQKGREKLLNYTPNYYSLNINAILNQVNKLITLLEIKKSSNIFSDEDKIFPKMEYIGSLL